MSEDGDSVPSRADGGGEGGSVVGGAGGSVVTAATAAAATATAASEQIDTTSLPTLIREWLHTEEELKTLSAAVKEKRTRIKTVRDMISKIMKAGAIGRLNISSGTVMVQPTKPKKDPLSKRYLITALTEYFKGDSAMAAACVAYLEAKRPMRGGERLILEPRDTATGGSTVTR